MKRYILLLVVLLPFLVTSCGSKEVSQARADYIDAKTRKLNAEAESLEIENQHNEALLAQRLDQEEQSRKAAEERRAAFERILVETLRILAYIITATGVAVTLSWAASGGYEVWARNRLKLHEASAKEAQARARAMREERRAQEAKVAALQERRSLTLAEAYRLKEERLLLKSKLSDNGRTLQAVASPNKSQLPVCG